MKFLTGIFFFLMLVSSALAQTPITVKISGTIFNSTSKEVVLSQQLESNNYLDVATAKMDKEGNFSISTKVPQSDYYILKVNEGIVHLILREQSDIKVYGDATQLNAHRNIVGSDESIFLNNFTVAGNQWMKTRNEAVTRMQMNPNLSEQINQEIQPVWKEFQASFQIFYQQNTNSPALIAALSVIDANQDFETFDQIAKELNRVFGQSVKVKEVMKIADQLRVQKEAANILAPGKTAPDFEELMVDRKTTMKLSDLKGKVVLLDFWASWCGPCRKENPNVVNIYNKYKDAGFTVMNVSLDDNLDRWKQAIEQDGLIWPNHVSDLRKWSSAAGQIYGVKSIPFTVLIDQEGRIVQTNLRGEALERAVAELLKK